MQRTHNTFINLSKFIFLLFLLYSITGCARKVNVELIDARIVNTTHRYLGRKGANLDHVTTAIQFNISSTKELADYFLKEKWTSMTVYCAAEGAHRKGDFENIGFGPFHKKKNLSKLFYSKIEKNYISYSNPEQPTVVHPKIQPDAQDSLFKYAVYSFLDLKAGYTQKVYGTPVTALDLINESFDKLNCFIRGFKYPPLIPPRTSEFSIDKEAFNSIHKDYLNGKVEFID